MVACSDSNNFLNFGSSSAFRFDRDLGKENEKNENKEMKVVEGE